MALVATCVIQSLIATSKVTNITTNIGVSIIMSTIRATTSSISNIISYIISEPTNNSEHIKQFLTKSDLYFTITTIQAFINEQTMNDSQKSVASALEGVSEILTTLHDDLQLIKIECENHKSKWFSGYRTFTWSKSIETLESHSNILNHRYNLLFELLKIARFNKDNDKGHEHKEPKLLEQ
jgi:hypothetical protein